MRQNLSVARAYAEALVEIGKERSALDAIRGEMAELRGSLAGDPAFATFLESPDVPAAEKAERIGRSLEGRLSPAVVNFLKVVVSRRRGAVLPDIFDQFEELYDRATGRITVRVEAPRPLSPALEARLEAAVREKTGLTPVLQFKERPELLGGLLAVVGDYLLDGTVRRDLRILSGKIRRNILRQQEVFA